MLTVAPPRSRKAGKPAGKPSMEEETEVGDTEEDTGVEDKDN